MPFTSSQGHPTLINFDTIKQTAMLRSEELLREWFPEGRVRGHEFVIGDAEGNAGDSLSINLNKGVGMDFATGQKFGDLIDVYAARFSCDLKQAAIELAGRLGIAVEAKDKRPHKKPGPKPKPPEAKKLTWREAWASAGCQPIPADVAITPEAFAIPRRGVPSHLYTYRDTDGTPLWVVARWDANDSEDQTKLFLPWQYRDGWVRGGVPAPRCLYGLETLNSPRNVIICEGEKAAEAARRLFPGSPVVSWPNGASSVSSADWSDLKGRKVVIWPDADAPGFAAMNEIGAILTPIVDGPVRYIDAGNVPPGYDAADLGNLAPSQAFEWAKPRIKVWEPPTVAEPMLTIMPAAPVPEPANPVAEVDPGWETYGLQLRANGTPHPSMDNAVRILVGKVSEGDIHYDSFLNQIRWRGHHGFEKLADHHLITMTIAIQREHRIQEMKKQTVADAVNFYARTRIRNCLTEWLQSLKWDSLSRVDKLLILGFGAEDTPYTRAVGRNFLISMIARAMRPGCQVDTLPILEGEQGIGKSQGLAALAGQFYADIDTAIGTREFAEQVQGKWLVELSELSAMRPSEVEKVKSGITRTVDVYREPFAILASDHPRQCVFAGTTNAQNYLHDSTGNRRFWPVKCGVIDRDWIKRNREQLFAEAMHAYSHGTTWWDMPGQMAEREAEARQFGDAIVERVSTYLDSHGTNVRVNEILESWAVPESQWSPPLQRRICDALRTLGWHSVKSNGRQVWRAPAGHGTADPFNVTPISGGTKQVRRL